MDFNSVSIQNYGFWAVLLIMIFQNLLIPLANRIVPAKLEQAAKLMERETIASEKEADALEQIGKALVSLDAKMTAYEHTQNTIMQALIKQGQVLAVLLDRKHKTSK